MRREGQLERQTVSLVKASKIETESHSGWSRGIRRSNYRTVRFLRPQSFRRSGWLHAPP